MRLPSRRAATSPRPPTVAMSTGQFDVVRGRSRRRDRRRIGDRFPRCRHRDPPDRRTLPRRVPLVVGGAGAGDLDRSCCRRECGIGTARLSRLSITAKRQPSGCSMPRRSWPKPVADSSPWFARAELAEDEAFVAWLGERLASYSVPVEIDLAPVRTGGNAPPHCRSRLPLAGDKPPTSAHAKPEQLRNLIAKSGLRCCGGPLNRPRRGVLRGQLDSAIARRGRENPISRLNFASFLRRVAPMTTLPKLVIMA